MQHLRDKLSTRYTETVDVFNQNRGFAIRTRDSLGQYSIEMISPPPVINNISQSEEAFRNFNLVVGQVGLYEVKGVSKRLYPESLLDNACTDFMIDLVLDEYGDVVSGRLCVLQEIVEESLTYKLTISENITEKLYTLY